MFKEVSIEITPAELIRTLNRAYAINASSIQQFGPVWKVHTPKGIFGFRQMKMGPEKLRELAEILETIKNKGVSLPSFLPTKTGEPFVIITGRLYVLLKWYEGENPLFTCTNHLQKTAGLYGKLHRISKTITLPIEWPLKNCLSEFQARMNFLKDLLSRLPCQKSLNRIDHAIINHGEHFLKQAALSIKGLVLYHYQDWLFNTPEKGFCHNDPAPLNIIIQNQNWTLIDFELSAYDAFIREFAKLTARALQINGWDHGILEILKEAYNEERLFSNEELCFLPYILCFPQRFWRFCSQRFEEKLDWTETRFQRKLWEIINDEKKRFLFLANLLPELT